ncbi:hypothetical protein [Ectothiorhodospira shaposhnikovii]|uniref:hypothetical protein n=1 Tax=Ectothiorhodospira shaposhnikovii TaxID=1054 RepID=UPI001EE8496D|nr:hypothetical protein [Ectothiorhodospira shaposhnikovii]MCG5512819.1 hypothetical protein [Ectothiorhodospira shaposhnikovii]
MSTTTVKGFTSVSEQIERARNAKDRIRVSDFVGAIPLLTTSVANAKIILYRRPAGGFFTHVERRVDGIYRHMDFNLSRRYAEYQQGEKAFYKAVRKCASDSPYYPNLHHPKMPVPASN